MKKLGIFMALFGTLLMTQADAVAEKERSEIADEYKWNLADLYADDEAWVAKKNEIAEEMKKVVEFKGKLGNSAADLLACLEFNSNIAKEFTRLYTYAFQKSDLDTRESGPQALKQQMQQLGTQFGSLASFIEPNGGKIHRR